MLVHKNWQGFFLIIKINSCWRRKKTFVWMDSHIIIKLSTYFFFVQHLWFEILIKNYFLFNSNKHVFWVVDEIRAKTKNNVTFFSENKGKKSWIFEKYVVLASKPHIFQKFSFFYLFLRTKRDILFRFCPDFENYWKHMLFRIKQKMVFDQTLESYLLYKKKMCGKFKYFPRLHSEKICFFKKNVLSLLFKNKRVAVILS